MRILSATEARQIDRNVEATQCIPLDLLMENAGAALANAVKDILEDTKLVTFILGTGNNGADGLVAMRHLSEMGVPVKALVLGNVTVKGSDLFKKQLAYAEAFGLHVEIISSYSANALTEKELSHIAEAIEASEIVVEGLMGTGFFGELKPQLKVVLQLMQTIKAKASGNRRPCVYVAIDVPAGLDCNTGAISPDVPIFDRTVTFGAAKQGMYLYPGASHCGIIQVERLGIPWQQILDSSLSVYYVEDSCCSWLPKRSAIAHKGRLGHTAIIGGSIGMLGAPVMAAKGALRSGAGKTTLIVPDDILSQVGPILDSEIMTKGFRYVEEIQALLNDKDVLAIGPGLGRSEMAKALLLEVIKQSNTFMQLKGIVLDADALYALGSGEEAITLLKQISIPVVITPHVGEFSRLTDLKASEIESDRVGVARMYAEKTGTIVVLKGKPTITALPNGNVYMNSTGNPGMAIGGMGDVLTGVIAAFIGQGVEPSQAAVLGVYLHGKAADLLATQKPWGYTPSEVAEAIVHAYMEYRG